MAIELNSLTKTIQITSPTTTVTIQELVDTIRDWEDELAHMSIPRVIDAVGKADLGGSVFTAITLTLSADWQIQFWNGVGIGFIQDGTLVGGVGGTPIKPTGGSDTILLTNQVGGTVALSGGAAPTVEQIRVEMESDGSKLSEVKNKTDNLPSGIKKNTALPKFTFFMVLTDHISPAPGKIITGLISKNGGPFMPIANSISEVGYGVYVIHDGFTQTEMNADTITLRFSGIGCDDRIIDIITN